MEEKQLKLNLDLYYQYILAPESLQEALRRDNEGLALDKLALEFRPEIESMFSKMINLLERYGAQTTVGNNT